MVWFLDLSVKYALIISNLREFFHFLMVLLLALYFCGTFFFFFNSSYFCCCCFQSCYWSFDLTSRPLQFSFSHAYLPSILDVILNCFWIFCRKCHHLQRVHALDSHLLLLEIFLRQDSAHRTDLKS